MCVTYVKPEAGVSGFAQDGIQLLSAWDRFQPCCGLFAVEGF